jgi:hypothetical protein
LEEKSNSRAVVLFACCIFIAYLLPYHVHPFRAFYNEWVLMLGIVVLLAFQADQKISPIRLPWIAIIPAGLATLILLQAACGMLIVSWDAVLPIAYLIFVTLAMVLGSSMIEGNRDRHPLYYALAVSHLIAGLLSAGIATLQFIGSESNYGYLVIQFPHDGKSLLRPFANVAQPNQLALLFCLAIASAWWLFQIGRLRKTSGILTIVVLLWGLAITQSRIGWLILPIFAFLSQFWRREPDFTRISVWTPAAGLFLYGGLVLMLPQIAEAFGSDVYNPIEHIGKPSHSERIVLFREAWHISLAHPIFGAGWYEFGPQQVAIGRDFPRGVYSQHAHNILLNFAAEIGWPFTLLIFGGLIFWFSSVCCRRGISKEVGFATLFFSAVIVHSLVEFPLWYAYVLLPVALLMGLVHRERFDCRSVEISRRYIAVICLIMSMGLVAVAADYRRVVVGFRALGWENLGLSADEGTTEKPGFTIFPEFYDYFRFAKTTAHKVMSSEQIAEMEKVMRRFGYAPVLMRMSLVYALNGRSEDAFNAMMTINRLHPAQYADAYHAWGSLVTIDPVSYSRIFKKLPPPDSKKAE